MGFWRFIVFLALVGGAAIVPFLDIVGFVFKAADEVTDPVAAQQVASTVRVSKIFLCIIVALFIAGFSQLFLRMAWMKSFASSIPGHLTALGILGTFVGIFFGLYRFEVGDLYGSIPRLLEGMKLAFTTSVAGLATSTVLRASHSLVVSITHEDPYGLPGDGDGGTIVVVPGFGEFALGSLLSAAQIAKKLEAIHDTLKRSKR